MQDHCELEEADVDGVHVVALHGDLDIDSAPQVCACLDEARLNGERKILLDLSDMSFCDSQGLRALIEEQKEMRVAGKRFGIVEPSEEAMRILEILGVREFLRLYASRGEAIEAL